MLTSGGKFRILLLEDSPDDAELLELELNRGELAADVVRVETLEQFTAALSAEHWDAVISDYRLPKFTASEALQAVKSLALDVPFIVISGAIGEETAVKLMRDGAHDFFLKDNLARLAEAIRREVRDAGFRGEHRHTLLKLRESEARFRTLADAAPVMIWSADPGLRRTYFNKPWLDFRGRTLEDELGEGWLEGVHLDDRQRVGEAQAELAARRPASIEYRLRRADGAYRWIMERTIPHMGPGGTFEGFLGSGVDITALKETEEALKHAVRSRDAFLSAASHELRTPLAGLVLQIDLLQKISTVRSPDETRQLESARRQLWRLAKLVDTMLDVTRITAGKFKPSPRDVDLAAVARDVLASLKDSLERSGSQLTARIGEVHGFWDPVHIETVVTNLVTNAIKYGGGAPIELVVEKAGSVARLAVSDHGIGIPADAQQRIFERFERVVAEAAYSGLGIGLWLVREIVEAHGGVVHVASVPGNTRFEVELPLTAIPKNG